MISNVYRYYLSQYGTRANSRYSTHTPSELKKISGKILKVNSLTPFYKLDLSEDAQKYAIDLKENADELSKIIYDLSSSNDSSIIDYEKIADSTDEQIVSAHYIGKDSTLCANPFQVEVKQLAEAQINTGNFLPQKSMLVSTGAYSFDLNVSNLTYQFEFNVETDDNTKSIQDKISRLINRSNLGLTSHVTTDSLDNSAIEINSESTGISSLKSTIFSIQPSSSPDSEDSSDKGKDEPSSNHIVSILGLNRTAQYPANAIFSIDGVEHSSNTNNYIINNNFELKFSKVTAQTPVTISFKNDTDAIVESISHLVDGYNKIISVTSNENSSKFIGNEKLKGEFANISNAYNDILKRSGIELNDVGIIELNKGTILDSVNDGTISDTFGNLGKFKNALQYKIESISLNPMNYVNNKIVSYKNPQKPSTTPYHTSLYSGMMFNGLI
ncbi:flagellar filament capping protein FliD [[Clostridium] fimetarium]|uniref:Flagellar hook-associated protein 2 n=1 Tax=[Clostridium] fimetarium TaxID=99656 RepID=A0A1I0P4R2_9FIRM|nr:flagellar filament capping protein FliD [[Clostridium] fimetarium]SEW09024.1 flagellar hook-associated protein 2 [[Clostridium] fimetarium]